mgnify:CR=1 FL=1
MSNNAKPQLVVWWVLWLAFQIGVVVIFFFLGGLKAEPQPSGVDSMLWLSGFVPLFLSVVVRVLLLPRASTAQSAFPLFIVGIALAEASCFLGLFIFPAHKLELFIGSFLGILQFVPVFAANYTSE